MRAKRCSRVGMGGAGRSGTAARGAGGLGRLEANPVEAGLSRPPAVRPGRVWRRADKIAGIVSKAVSAHSLRVSLPLPLFGPPAGPAPAEPRGDRKGRDAGSQPFEAACAYLGAQSDDRAGAAVVPFTG